MGKLTEPLRSRLQTMMDDAPGGGLRLVSGFRDPGRQWDLRNRVCPGRECDPGCPGNPLTALPGSSNHQRGTAADIGGRNLKWANRNKSRYGLKTPVRGEPWHFEVAGRPSATIRSATEPKPIPIILEDDDDMFTFSSAGKPVFFVAGGIRTGLNEAADLEVIRKECKAKGIPLPHFQFDSDTFDRAIRNYPGS